MMARRMVERGLWGVAGLGMAVAIIGTRMAMATPAAVTPVIWNASHGPVSLAHESLEVFARTIVRGDPFRIERAPAAVPYQAGPSPETGGTPPTPAKPPLALAGLIGGPPWAAILEGMPGQTGSVIARTGDVFGALRVRHIDHDGAVITGMDTTWILTLKHRWH